MMYQTIVKPIVDLTAAFVLVVLFSPVLLLVSILLMLIHRGNPFLLQERGGYKNKIFKVIKFKTMTDEKDERGQLKSDAERLFFVGRVIRELSLDEIPQLLNVLKGDMSLIGPRPFLAEYLEIYTNEEKCRHDVKPGITGWAQVNGRNSISWKERLGLDAWYVENISFGLDMRIAVKTIGKTLYRGDVNQGTTTMEKYNGSN